MVMNKVCNYIKPSANNRVRMSEMLYPHGVRKTLYLKERRSNVLCHKNSDHTSAVSMTCLFWHKLTYKYHFDFS